MTYLDSKKPLHLAHFGYEDANIFGTKVWGGSLDFNIFKLWFTVIATRSRLQGVYCKNWNAYLCNSVIRRFFYSSILCSLPIVLTVTMVYINWCRIAHYSDFSDPGYWQGEEKQKNVHKRHLVSPWQQQTRSNLIYGLT